jgi:hypothetical protein
MAFPFEFMETHGSGLSYAPFDSVMTGAITYPYAEFSIPSAIENYPSRGPSGLLDTTFKINKEVMMENTRELLPTQQALPPSRQQYQSAVRSQVPVTYGPTPTPIKRQRQRVIRQQSSILHIILLIIILFSIHD